MCGPASAGVRFTNENPPSDLEMVIRRATALPGCTDYSPTPLPTGGLGFRFGPARERWLRALSVLRSKSGLYGAFVWARSAPNRPNWRFPARAGAAITETELERVMRRAKELPSPDTYSPIKPKRVRAVRAAALVVARTWLLAVARATWTRVGSCRDCFARVSDRSHPFTAPRQHCNREGRRQFGSLFPIVRGC
jgi:hypothetical protein